jgi:hypothetical protein
MLEGIVYLVFCLGIGYVVYWCILVEKPGARDRSGWGWIAMKQPPAPPEGSVVRAAKPAGRSAGRK